MPVETPSLFAQVIQDHLELKRRNARARRHDAARPLLERRPVRQPPALQVRGAGAPRGDHGRRARRRAHPRRALPWPGEETQEQPTEPRSRISLVGHLPRASSTGATSPTCRFREERSATRLGDDGGVGGRRAFVLVERSGGPRTHARGAGCTPRAPRCRGAAGAPQQLASAARERRRRRITGRRRSHAATPAVGATRGRQRHLGARRAAPVARAVASEAYRAGASRPRPVQRPARPPRLDRVSAGGGARQDPAARRSTGSAAGRDGTAFIQLTGDPNPTLFADLDPERVGRSEPIDYRRASGSRTCRPAPSTGRSSRRRPRAGPQTVFGEPDLERLWEAVATATRLDQPDPVAAWSEHVARLKARAAGAERAPLRRDPLPRPRHRPHRRAPPGVALPLRDLRDARRPRAPAERPDRGGLHHARTGAGPRARALDVPARGRRHVVNDLEVRFEGGRIVDVSASSGSRSCEHQLATDEQARFLGEVALVDGTSAVKRTGLVFKDTLFDENATCHIAYGNGLPMCVDGADGLGRRRAARARRQHLGRAHGLHDRRRPRSRSTG